MPKRELSPERDKRRKDHQAKNAAGSSLPPSEDEPEQVVSPETESEITKSSRDSLVTTKPKRKK